MTVNCQLQSSSVKIVNLISCFLFQLVHSKTRSEFFSQVWGPKAIPALRGSSLLFSHYCPNRVWAGLSFSQEWSVGLLTRQPLLLWIRKGLYFFQWYVTGGRHLFWRVFLSFESVILLAFGCREQNLCVVWLWCMSICISGLLASSIASVETWGKKIPYSKTFKLDKPEELPTALFFGSQAP